jgi:hypothetical protein
MTRKLFAPILAILLALMACSIPSSTPTVVPVVITNTTLPPVITETPTITETPGITPAAPGDLSLDMLRNATYFAPFYERTITLVNGSYSEGSGASTYSVYMLGIYAFGDLNGDGKFDAAVILVENGGGSGSFVSVVAVTNLGGAPHQVSEVQLGDRVQVSSADISLGVIHLNMLVQGPSDPLCCPSQAETQSFWLMGNKLWLMRLVSGAPGSEWTINITSPANWGNVTNPFTVSGDVSILPFENTLGYGIYLLDGTKINESSLLVTPSVGTSGTFSQNINLSAAGISGLVIVQFKDLSAADGSTLALGSVVVNLP